ncbi:hypothetical protein J2T32_000150 [Kerstersia gyiorum]|nr:hypothetical protein [Kerstersia gyiorum]MCP1680868.1 hypothetical protein [Kerstersia gyiorum]MCP1716533.1 hypothetical protein [Kerstersia gyiorum]MCW2185234.1 hypothetical protein [Kerstersia gyiorum]
MGARRGLHYCGGIDFDGGGFHRQASPGGVIGLPGVFDRPARYDAGLSPSEKGLQAFMPAGPFAYCQDEGEDLPLFPDINPVAIRISKHECALAAVLVAQGFDDAHPCAYAQLVERVDIIDEHVQRIHAGGKVLTILAEMDFGGIFFQHHETDRIAVFEGFLKPENARVKGQRCLDITDGQAWRGTDESDGLNDGWVHRKFPTNNGRGGDALARSGAVSYLAGKLAHLWPEKKGMNEPGLIQWGSCRGGAQGGVANAVVVAH